MVRQDLQPRPDDEDHEQQVENVRHRDPDRQARIALRAGRRDGPRVLVDEVLHRRDATQALAGRDQRDEDDEADRQRGG